MAPLGDRLGGGRRKVAELAAALSDIEESPWGDLRGKPLDARGLARRLKPFGIRPSSHRLEGRVLRGYEAADFVDAWARYVPGLAATSATTATRPADAADEDSGVADVADVAVPGERPMQVGFWKPQQPELWETVIP